MGEGERREGRTGGQGRRVSRKERKRVGNPITFQGQVERGGKWGAQGRGRKEEGAEGRGLGKAGGEEEGNRGTGVGVQAWKRVGPSGLGCGGVWTDAAGHGCVLKPTVCPSAGLVERRLAAQAHSADWDAEALGGARVGKKCRVPGSGSREGGREAVGPWFQLIPQWEPGRGQCQAGTFLPTFSPPGAGETLGGVSLAQGSLGAGRARRGAVWRVTGVSPLHLTHQGWDTKQEGHQKVGTMKPRRVRRGDTEHLAGCRNWGRNFTVFTFLTPHPSCSTRKRQGSEGAKQAGKGRKGTREPFCPRV